MSWSIIVAFSMLMLIFNYTKWYTLVTFGLLTIILLAAIFSKSQIFKRAKDHLFVAWIICLLPMSYVNGVLTGKPILIYNNTENCTVRIGTIPLEDFFYHLLYMVIMIFIYEYIKSKKIKTVN